MHRHFEDELSELRSELLYMASLAEKAVVFSVDSLKNRDAALAQKIIDDDAQINQLEVKIDDLCVELIARIQPMASDLRFVTFAMRINSDLERIGDHAVNIAQHTLELLKEPELKPLIDIPRMASLAQGMVKSALDAFVHGDVPQAIAVCKSDDEVDALEDQVLRELITYMSNDPRTISRAIHLIMIAKNLERVADLATNVAEEVVFMVEARSIKHHLGKEDVHESGIKN
ncbi:MAG: phosphate signaling complex protein PhoU [candidate division KSB1 bacterium]|nr:phosphate signaling complex protein PhoU [candidate division KSB1 bacterium]MDZ7301284.1 phosphate signaling complex protein PhoU [candidate division KSB1 bacterium]MDZ7310831.1 phosphate signaling complex protein PhoU [candidate division KSB1 bacterium]